ncbi:MAG TPA: hypothetical protein VGM94_05195 [Galbitalea sp.]|jgi:hypothetical protein
MKILSYSGESVVVSDRMGDTVVDYARALAAQQSADVIDVPVAEGSGTATARLLIGPSSQIISLPSHEPDVDLADGDLIEELQSRIRALSPERSYAARSDTWHDDATDDLDFL